LIPPREQKETMGCLWTSSIYPESAPERSLLFRVMFGGVLHPEAIDWSPGQLLTAYYRDVQTPLGFDGRQELLRVMHHRRGIPQYGLDHGDVLAEAEAAERAHPGLYFTGSALRGVAMIDCVADARRVADRVLGTPSS
jgi:oxygen-dependent protoporphyrinogen oxidase